MESSVQPQFNAHFTPVRVGNKTGTLFLTSSALYFIHLRDETLILASESRVRATEGGGARTNERKLCGAAAHGKAADAHVSRLDGAVALQETVTVTATEVDPPDSTATKDIETKVYELTVVIPLHQWITTERSKKTAKARVSYITSSANAASAATATPASCSIVFDFLDNRSSMDAACSLLQILHGATRQRPQLHNQAIAADPQHLLLLKRILALPPESILVAAEGVVVAAGDVFATENVSAVNSLLLQQQQSNAAIDSARTAAEAAATTAAAAYTSSFPYEKKQQQEKEKEGKAAAASSSACSENAGDAFTPAIGAPSVYSHSLQETHQQKTQEDHKQRCMTAISVENGSETDETVRLGVKRKSGILRKCAGHSSKSFSASLLESEGPACAVDSSAENKRHHKLLHQRQQSHTQQEQRTTAAVSLGEVKRQQQLRETEQRRQAERMLLENSLELRNLYIFLVGDPHEYDTFLERSADTLCTGAGASADAAAADAEAFKFQQQQQGAKSSCNGGMNDVGRFTRRRVLSREEFWRLHEAEVLAHLPQNTPESTGARFLLRPPHFEQASTASAKDKKTVLSVDCSEEMLQVILREDPHIKEAYQQFVASGRMTKEKFWERVLQSHYVQEFLGISDMSQYGCTPALASEDPGACLSLGRFRSYLTASAQDVMALALPTEDLVSTEAFRLRGFGTADGLNSFSGDLVDSSSSCCCSTTNTTKIATSVQNELVDSSSGMEQKIQHADRYRPLRNCLLDRFNIQSHRLLLQQLLPPAAVPLLAESAAPSPHVNGAASAVLQQQQQQRAHAELLLLKQQEQQMLELHFCSKDTFPQSEAKKTTSSVQQPILRDSSLSEKEKAIAEGLCLSDLVAAESRRFQPLEVSRRQLYAACSRGPLIQSQDSTTTRSSIDKTSSKEAQQQQLRVAGPSAFHAATARVEKSRAPQQEGEQRHDDDELLRTEATIYAARRHALYPWLENADKHAEGKLLVLDSKLFKTGRYMFVYSTKLCQSEKAAHVATLDYEPLTVTAICAQQARVTELLQHFYSSAVPNEEKRTRIIGALDAVKHELQHTQDSSFGPYTGAATKALCMPLFDQINAAKVHHTKLKKLLAELRAQRKLHHLRHASIAATASGMRAAPAACTSSALRLHHM